MSETIVPPGFIIHPLLTSCDLAVVVKICQICLLIIILLKM